MLRSSLYTQRQNATHRFWEKLKNQNWCWLMEFWPFPPSLWSETSINMWYKLFFWQFTFTELLVNKDPMLVFRLHSHAADPCDAGAVGERKMPIWHVWSSEFYWVLHCVLVCVQRSPWRGSTFFDRLHIPKKSPWFVVGGHVLRHWRQIEWLFK